MKRILFPTVLLATVVLGGILAFFIWQASPVTAEQFLESGKKYYQGEKYSEAVVQLLNAIQKDGRNRDARYYLALSYIQQKNLNPAAQQLTALLEYYPDDVPANVALGNVYLTAGQFDTAFFQKAKEKAEKVLAQQPENVEGLILLGNASAGLQDYRSSEEIFGKASILDPKNTDILVNLGTVQRLEKNDAAAEQALLKARQINPKDRAVIVTLATFYISTGATEKADALLSEGLALYPADPAVYNQALKFYFRQKRFGEVEKTLRNAQEKGAKDNPEPLMVLADVYRVQGRQDDSRKLLTDLKQKFPGNVMVQAKLAEGLMQNQPAQAKTEIDEIVKNDPKNPLGAILLGQWQLAAGQTAAAETTFSTNPAIGSAYPHPHYFLGNLALRKGNVDEAQDHYQKALQINNGYLPARVALAEVFLKRGRLDDAREEIRKALAADTGFPQARLVKAALDTAQKDFAQAGRDLEKLEQELPANALVHRQKAFLYAAQGRKTDAEKSLLRAFELAPGADDILQALTEFYLDNKQPERALQVINSVADDRKQAVHYELLGLVYFRAGRLPEAESAYKKAREKDPSRGNSEIYLTAQYLESGRLNEALGELDKLIKRDPTNASAYATKALVYQSQGKLAEAKDNYNEALKADPEHDAAANNLAYILAEEGADLNNALGLAQVARRKQPENPNAADTLGWVYYKLGNQVLARAQLQFAVSKQPDNAVYYYHLGMIYKANNQFGEAQTAFKKALALGTAKEFKEKPLAENALKELANLR
jgi:tetratricopeptide (TPR) repeat protein